MIEYRTFGLEQLTQILDIYRKAGWTAYLSEEDKMARAIQNSLYL